ncbi:GTPase IMAP family member 8 [Dicentrarchus labrax]|uniref:AIG1-type G domain-containing protein n=1 Tax=Dicentrarchus labrax TaxID=13489 RepID=A0A8P4JYS2_DICLA|nr:GTPase IMAP family member 8 [Dicentrarchus labrax]
MESDSAEEKSVTENSNCCKDIRIVLLGGKFCGKSETGNTILGCEGFDFEDETVGNTVRHGEVAGRWRVTLVESPGWWKTLYPDETLELTKMALIQSVSLCAPGPHAFLLVVDLDSILEEKSGKSVEEHLELLGDGVWNHTLVLLKCGTWQLMYTTVGEYMEKRGKVLRRIVEKCSGRSHILNNNNKSSRTQVIVLLEKIEKMVAANGGKLFEVDAAVAQDVERRMTDVNKKAKERATESKAERDALRETYKDEIYRLPEIKLLVAGWFLSGKTRVADTILGIPLGERKRTHHSELRQSQVGRWMVQLVDTPGWLRFSSLKDTPEMVKQEIIKGVSLCSPGPHAIILVISASIAFTKAHLRSIREHMSLLAPDVWRHTLVLFSWCDSIGGTTVEQFIESEGSALQLLLRKCNNRYHSFNIRSDDPTQVTGLLEKIEWMVAENSILRLNANETDKWEEEEAVTEAMSPLGESLVEMFENFYKGKEEDLIMSLRRILVRQEDTHSISQPPEMSDEEYESNERMLSTWLREQQCTREDTSEYHSDLESLWSNQ